MKEKCIELREYFHEQLVNQYGITLADKWGLAVAAGQSVVNYCDFMLLFGDTNYNWEEMKHNLLFKGTGVEW